MRTRVLVLLFVVPFGGCENFIPPKKKGRALLAVDLETNFQNHFVEVLIDNRVVFEGTATTRAQGMLNFAERIVRDEDVGIHV